MASSCRCGTEGKRLREQLRTDTERETKRKKERELQLREERKVKTDRNRVIDLYQRKGSA